MKTIADMPKQPKYSVGQNLQLKSPTLYDETQGVVEKIERIYKRIYPTGEFDPDGLVTSESTIGGRLPYEFDGETLVVDYSSIGHGFRKETSKFYGYAYTIRTPKMLSQYNEKSLSDKLKTPVVDTTPKVECPRCKGAKKMKYSFTEFGGKTTEGEMDCITCHGEGVVLPKKAATHKASLNAWCKCEDKKVWNDPRHVRSGGQDYYYCKCCNKLLQVG